MQRAQRRNHQRDGRVVTSAAFDQTQSLEEEEDALGEWADVDVNMLIGQNHRLHSDAGNAASGCIPAAAQRRTQANGWQGAHDFVSSDS